MYGGMMLPRVLDERTHGRQSPLMSACACAQLYEPRKPTHACGVDGSAGWWRRRQREKSVLQ